MTTLRVTPLIQRHVDDLAFYWLQLDAPFPGAEFDAEKAAHFQELMSAHQDGIRVAGIEAVHIALENLERWRKPGEAFAAMFAALSVVDAQQRDDAITRVFRVVRRLPDVLMRGVISAVAFAPREHVAAWLPHALRSDDGLLITAAIRAVALLDLTLPDWERFSVHADPHVRAAALRTANARVSLAESAGVNPLADAGTKEDNVRLEAERVITWARTTALASNPSSTEIDKAASRLWRSIVEQLQVTQAATGGNRVQATRRLDRWIRHLALLVPAGHPSIPQLLEHLPRRQALGLALHHADPTRLHFVVQCMGDASVARWAGWVWECLTGVDLEREGLTLAEPPVYLNDPLSESRHDGDLGLVLPDPAKVAAHPASSLHLETGQRVLLGQPITADLLRQIISPSANQPQALRLVAARCLSRLAPDQNINLRARPEIQRDQLQRLGLH